MPSNVYELLHKYKTYTKSNPQIAPSESIRNFSRKNGVNAETLQIIIENSQKVASLDSIAKSDNTTITDKVSVAEDNFSQRETGSSKRALINELLNRLSPEELIILKMRYGLTDTIINGQYIAERPMSYIKIGKKMGFSKETIRKREKRILQHLRLDVQSMTPMDPIK